MKLGTVTQQPAERLSYTFSYEDFLTDGDNVVTATAQVTATDGLAVDLVADAVSVFDPRVKFWVRGGTAGRRYKVTIDVSTADGRELQDELIIRIKDY